MNDGPADFADPIVAPGFSIEKRSMPTDSRPSLELSHGLGAMSFYYREAASPEIDEVLRDSVSLF